MVETLKLTRVRAGYGPTVVLEDVDLELPEHGSLAVLGRNGVGKTTLLATIMGHTTFHAGSIEYKGRPIMWLPVYERARLGIVDRELRTRRTRATPPTGGRLRATDRLLHEPKDAARPTRDRISQHGIGGLSDDRRSPDHPRDDRDVATAARLAMRRSPGLSAVSAARPVRAAAVIAASAVRLGAHHDRAYHASPWSLHGRRSAQPHREHRVLSPSAR